MNNIKKIRKAHRFTQKKLAAEIGVDASVVSKYEHGIITPPIEKVQAIAKIFDVTIEELMAPENELCQFEDMHPIYMTNEEKEHMEAAAKKKGLSIAEYIKEALSLMEQDITPKTHQKHQPLVYQKENLECLDGMVVPDKLIPVNDIYGVEIFVATDSFLVYIMTRKNDDGITVEREAYLQHPKCGIIEYMFGIQEQVRYHSSIREEGKSREFFKQMILDNIGAYIEIYREKYIF